MTKTQTTYMPGPWLPGRTTITSDWKSLYAVEAEDDSENDGVVAYVLNPKNRPLIAAAPELLQELEKAVNSMTQGVRWCIYCGYPDPGEIDAKPMWHTSTCWVPRAEAAITKARGDHDDSD